MTDSYDICNGEHHLVCINCIKRSLLFTDEELKQDFSDPDNKLYRDLYFCIWQRIEDFLDAQKGVAK